ncbi:MAG: ABC transporter substrate-binding protein [Spirochaetes bacterium]|nr:ABC transporter substrate-binding protein [Spirochaetota bacterium]
MKLFVPMGLILLIIPTLGFPRGAKEEKPIRMALSGNPDTLDPQKTAGTLTFQVTKSIYDTLVEPDEKGNLVPALAEGWEFQDEGRRILFRLRKGVTFHDGTPFTSKDVAITLKRIQDKNTGSPHAAEYSQIERIDTPDPSTVILQLSSPSAPLLATLASGWSAILPAHLIESGHDFGSKPVGSGPFRFKSWVRDNQILLEKNPSYWMPGKPKVVGVEFRIITERSIQVQGLLSGQLDVIDMYDAIDLPLLQKNPNVKVEKVLTSLVMVLAMNTSKPPLSDLRVRQAINFAIQKQEVLDVAYGGGVPVGTFMDASDPYYADYTSFYPYNPEKAKNLLKDAGVGTDRTLEMVLPQNFEPHVRAGQIYQEMLQKVGLSVKIRLVDWSTWISDVYRKANYDLTVIGHTGKLDPDSRLVNYGTDKTYVRWVHPEVASLITKARSIVNPNERKALYHRVLEIMAKEVPFVYVGTSYRYVGMRKTLEGFRIQPKLDAYDFRYVEVR